MSSNAIHFPSRSVISKYLKNCFKEEKLVDDYLADVQADPNRITDRKIISAVATTFAKQERNLEDIRLEIRMLINDLDKELLLTAERILAAGSRISLALYALTQQSVVG